MNMALRREFRLTEHLNLQIEAEAFNVFNHPMFGGWVLDVVPPEFGCTICGTATQMLNRSYGSGLNRLYQIGGPRSMQFSARIAF
jgi:hypothetical protein